MGDLEILKTMVRVILKWEENPKNVEAFNLKPETSLEYGLRGAWDLAWTAKGYDPTEDVLSHLRTLFLANPLRLLKLPSAMLADELMQISSADESIEGQPLPCPKWEALQAFFPNVLQAKQLYPRTEEESRALKSLLKALRSAGVPC